jgi:hypothetical protein
MSKFIIASVFALFFKISASAQTVSLKDSSIKTSMFNDGVYLSLYDLQNNHPSITKEHLIKSYYDKSDFSISQWAATTALYYMDDNEKKQKVNRDSLWGYVENGTPYILINDRFHRFSTAGKVSVFTESYPTIKAGMAPVVTEAKSVATTQLFILASGKIMEFTPENVAIAIADNPILLEEFKALKTWKQKRKKMYRFVERYNEN